MLHWLCGVWSKLRFTGYVESGVRYASLVILGQGVSNASLGIWS